ADGHEGATAAELPVVLAQRGPRARQGEGEDVGLGLDGQAKGTILEGQEVVGGRARAFGEDHHGHVAAEIFATPLIARLADSLSPRTTGTSPARCMSQPTMGVLMMLALLSHFISHGRYEMRKGSACEQWLQMTTV